MSNEMIRQILELDLGVRINPEVEVFINDELCTDFCQFNYVRENADYMGDVRPSVDLDIIEVYYNEVK